MATVKPPPIYNPVVDENGIATIPWTLFFTGVYNGDTGKNWTPVANSLTTAGGGPTITGKIYQIGQSLAYFAIKVVPASGGSTTSTAGTTYFSGFPLILRGDGACIAVSGLLSTTPGMCDQASNRIYVPSWTTVTVPLTIVGFVEAS